MIRLGIVGSENSHGPAVAQVCNLMRKVPMRVTHLWGENPESSRAAATKGEIPQIVDDWRDLAGAVDAVMINHRHGRDHFVPAAFFIQKGLPVFVDKPITDSLAEAQKLFALAHKKRAPLATFGVLPLQKSFARFQRRVQDIGQVVAVSTTGPVDVRSPHGGVFFYGFHQVDVITELLGTRACAVTFQKSGDNGIATIRYDNGCLATVHCLKSGEFHWTAAGSLHTVSEAHRYDEIPYLTYTRKLHRLFAAGETPAVERMLAPIAILESLWKAVESGREQKVKSLGRSLR